METTNSPKEAAPRANALTYILLTLPFAALCLLMIASGSANTQAADDIDLTQQVDVIAVTIESQYMQDKVATGRVESQLRANIGFELAGTLDVVPVDEGQSVAKGDVLAKLDVARLEAQSKELEAALSRAKSQQRLAKLSEDRVVDLVARELESPQRLDEVREATITAQAQVDEILAKIDSLDVLLQKSALLAPFDAVVIGRPVDPGTVVSAGQPIMTLFSQNTVEARVSLSADDAFTLQVGDVEQLHHGGHQADAVVKSIGNQRNLVTRTVDVIFELSAGSQSLLPGDLVSFTYQKPIQKQGTWVPNLALSSGTRGLWNVYVVTKDNRSEVQARAVEVLYTNGQNAFVTGALRDGDLLVVDGTHRVVTGQTVIPRKREALAQVTR